MYTCITKIYNRNLSRKEEEIECNRSISRGCSSSIIVLFSFCHLSIVYSSETRKRITNNLVITFYQLEISDSHKRSRFFSFHIKTFIQTKLDKSLTDDSQLTRKSPSNFFSSLLLRLQWKKKYIFYWICLIFDFVIVSTTKNSFSCRKRFQLREK